MLVCRTVHNRVIFPLRYLDESRLRLLSRGKRLICPLCKGLVIYRRGFKIPHFAHYRKCTIPYWEPESEEHMLGKQMLFNICTTMNLKCNLEQYIPETKQIADVFIEPNVALEVQLSRLRTEEYASRRMLYGSLGIKDFWFWRVGNEPIHENRELLSISSPYFTFSINALPVIIKPLQNQFIVSLSAYYAVKGRPEQSVSLVRYDISSDKGRFWRGIVDTDDRKIRKNIIRWEHCFNELAKFHEDCMAKYQYYNSQWGYKIVKKHGFSLKPKGYAVYDEHLVAIVNEQLSTNKPVSQRQHRLSCQTCRHTWGPKDGGGVICTQCGTVFRPKRALSGCTHYYINGLCKWCGNQDESNDNW